VISVVTSLLLFTNCTYAAEQDVIEDPNMNYELTKLSTGLASNLLEIKKLNEAKKTLLEKIEKLKRISKFTDQKNLKNAQMKLQFAKTRQYIKDLENTIKNYETRINNTNQSIEKISKEIEKINNGSSFKLSNPNKISIKNKSKELLKTVKKTVKTPVPKLVNEIKNTTKTNVKTSFNDIKTATTSVKGFKANGLKVAGGGLKAFNLGTYVVDNTQQITGVLKKIEQDKDSFRDYTDSALKIASITGIGAVADGLNGYEKTIEDIIQIKGDLNDKETERFNLYVKQYEGVVLKKNLTTMLNGKYYKKQFLKIDTEKDFNNEFNNIVKYQKNSATKLLNDLEQYKKSLEEDLYALNNPVETAEGFFGTIGGAEMLVGRLLARPLSKDGIRQTVLKSQIQSLDTLILNTKKEITKLNDKQYINDNLLPMFTQAYANTQINDIATTYVQTVKETEKRISNLEDNLKKLVDTSKEYVYEVKNDKYNKLAELIDENKNSEEVTNSVVNDIKNNMFVDYLNKQKNNIIEPIEYLEEQKQEIPKTLYSDTNEPPKIASGITTWSGYASDTALDQYGVAKPGNSGVPIAGKTYITFNDGKIDYIRTSANDNPDYTKESANVTGLENHIEGEFEVTDGETTWKSYGSYSYTYWGQWESPNATPTYDIKKAYWIVGQTATDIPQQGTAQYKGVVKGFEFDNNKYINDLSGTTNINIDFGTSAVTGDMHIENPANGVTFADVSINGNISNGDISMAQLSGDNVSSWSKINATVYGPEAQELGGFWWINKTDGHLGQGLISAKKQ